MTLIITMVQAAPKRSSNEDLCFQSTSVWAHRHMDAGAMTLIFCSDIWLTQLTRKQVRQSQFSPPIVDPDWCLHTTRQLSGFLAKLALRAINDHSLGPAFKKKKKDWADEQIWMHKWFCWDFWYVPQTWWLEAIWMAIWDDWGPWMFSWQQ